MVVRQPKVLCKPKALCQPLGVCATIPIVTLDFSGALPLARVNQEPVTVTLDSANSVKVYLQPHAILRVATSHLVPHSIRNWINNFNAANTHSSHVMHHTQDR